MWDRRVAVQILLLRLEGLEDGLGGGLGQLSRRLLDHLSLDDSLVGNESVASGANTKTSTSQISLLVDGTSEFANGVGIEGDLSVRLHGLSPSVHHEVVVHRYDGNLINSLRLEVVNLVDERGDLQMTK